MGNLSLPWTTDYRSLARILSASAEIAKAPPIRTADEWADEHRMLPPGSPEPGRWRTSRVPYTRDIYRAFSNPRVETVVGVMGSQMSKSEALINLIGHRFSDGPYVPVLYIGPTEKNVRSMSNDRVRKLIESTPKLYERLAKGQDDKITEKWIAGIRLGFAWAGSATELASHPAGLVLVDERDRMLNDVGGEGDPVEMARARGSNFPGFKLGVFSTPTVEGASPIWSLFLSGTMRKWAWQCTACNEWFVPRLELLVYPKERRDLDTLEREAGVVCEHCGTLHLNAAKKSLNANGRYLAHTQDAEGKHIPVPFDEPVGGSTESFWVSGLCSPWQSFGQRAERLIKAYASQEPERIQAVINTGFGELYRIKGDAPPWEHVMEARDIGLAAKERPAWTKLVTCGVDVQKRGLYFCIRAWGFNNRSHLIEHGYIEGETEYDDVWILLRQILDQQVGGRFLIDRTFIDSGYKPGSGAQPDHKVYSFCRLTQGRAMPTKGQQTQDRPLKTTKVDVSVSGRILQGSLILWNVDTDHFKRWVHAQLQIPEGGTRLWTTHRDITEDYCRQLVAEERVSKASGRVLWVKRGQNHYFDCEVLARAAAVSRQVESIAGRPEPKAAPEQAAQPDNSSRKQNAPASFFNRPAGGFIRPR